MMERWCWRLLPVAAALAAFAVWSGRHAGDSLLPVVVASQEQDWALARTLTGKPL